MAVVGMRFPPQLLFVAIVIATLNFYYIYNLYVKKNELKTSVDYYEEALSVARQKYKALEKSSQRQLTSKDSRIKELDQQVMAKHNTLGNLQSALAGLKKDVAKKNNDIQELQKLGSNYKKEITNLETSMLESKESLRELSTKTKLLMSDITDEKAKFKKENENLNAEIKRYQDGKAAYDQQIMSYMKRNDQLSRQVGNLTRSNNELQETIKEKIKESYFRYKRTVIPHHDSQNENQPDTGESLLVAKETGSVAKETGSVAKETGSVAKETGSVAKETGSVAKETGSVTKETGSVTKETGSVTKETGSVAKETAAVGINTAPIANATSVAEERPSDAIKTSLVTTETPETVPQDIKTSPVTKETPEADSDAMETSPVSKETPETDSHAMETSPVSKETPETGPHALPRPIAPEIDTQHLHHWDQGEDRSEDDKPRHRKNYLGDNHP